MNGYLLVVEFSTSSARCPGRAAVFNSRTREALMAYNFAKRLKTLKGLTPYEHICKVWMTQPNRFRLNPLHHTVGLNT